MPRSCKHIFNLHRLSIGLKPISVKKFAEAIGNIAWLGVSDAREPLGFAGSSCRGAGSGLFGLLEASVGIQCADLIVSITAAAERGGGQVRGYLTTLLPRFATHPATGELASVGPKRFPKPVPRQRGESKLF
jgi:hypothetical protein